MRLIIRYTFYSILFVYTHFVNGQIHDFIQYGIVDGLAHAHVTDICQDKQGNIWFATQGGGVSKFNGINFKNYTVRDGLASNYLRKVAVDNNNNIWFATAEGLSVLKNNKIYNHLETDSMRNLQLSGSINTLFADSNNNIWFATGVNGIARLSESGILEVFNNSNGFVNDRVIDIAQDVYGQVWFVTILNGLYRYGSDRFEHVIGVEDVKGYILSADVSGDSLLIGTNNGTFIAKVESNGSLIIDQIELLNNVFVKSIVSREEEKWAITANGLMMLKDQNRTILSAENGFTDGTVLSGFRDREGNMWFGTNGDGVFRYTDASFTKLSNKNLSDVRSITKDNEGNLLMTTFGNGVIKYDGKHMFEFMPKQESVNSYVTASVIDKNGNLWLGTRNEGVTKFTNEKVINYKVENGLVNNSVRSLFCDINNNIWIITTNGLSKFSNDSIDNFTTSNGLLNSVVWNVIEDENQLLFVTRNGINSYDNNGLGVLDSNEVIFNKRVNYIAKSTNDVYWIGYSGYGICKYNIATGETKFITTENGLISDIILSIVILNPNELLVATERGVDEIILDDESDVLSIRHYGNTEKGVGLCNSNPGAFYIDESKVWFGAVNGVFCFDEKKELNNSIEPIINITDVDLIFEEDSIISEYVSNIGSKSVKIPYVHNSIQISYFGTHIKHSGNVLYRYKLEGFQNDWSAITNNQHVSYTNLPPNKYTFKVNARNNEGLWTSEPAIFEFEILPPFYLTIWFFAFIIISVILITRYVYLFRVHRRVQKALSVEKIKDEEALRVRKMMARDFHDNMGNQLASITVFTNLISLKLKDSTEEIKGLLSNIEKHSKSLYTGTKDFIWSMDPGSDNLLEIFTYLKDFGEDLFEGTQISFYSDADVLEKNNVIVPSGWSRQLVLIFKEAMTNALKYSEASKVELFVNLNDEEFVVSFKDNGKGFDFYTVDKGNGLRNMEQRSNNLGAKFKITQLSEGGVLISLSSKK